ncbi:sensor histidine kinase [Nocardioides insulae]|uniref:sensor histidine kinase n=1 Tax=Nocardioides insulae TaxID=394734 RepID=UPI0003FE268E|nr:HAMP domain-containing sensor histidine kinase [Nocardioides insulae]
MTAAPSGTPTPGGPDPTDRVRSFDERRWHYRRSLASRVVILTTLAVGITVAVISFGVYWSVRLQLSDTLDDSLLERAHGAASNADKILAARGNVLIEQWVLGAGDVRLAVLDPDRTVHIPDLSEGAFPRLSEPEYGVVDGDTPYSIRTISTVDDDYRVVTVPIESTGQAFVLAESLAPQQAMLQRLGVVMFSFGIAGVIASGMAGWAVAANGLRPVRRLTAAAERIARTEDLTPLPVEGDDEVARLATAFNSMLVALDASRERQRQLVADAGHELRTPLTSMRTNIDLLSQMAAAPDNPYITHEARQELLADVRAQMEELTQLIGDLVELARDEPLAPVVTAVELPSVVEQAVNRVRRRAPSVSFEVTTEPWWVIGEAAGLERAITNLLDNAAKFSPPEGTVRVSLSRGLVTVEDEGPGIAEEDLQHVFDRFYRATASRSMPGSGLGLSIVRQVAERHGGTVSAGRAASGGARMEFRVPGSTEPAPSGPPA